MSAGSVLRAVAGEVLDFVSFSADLLGRPAVRSAVLADLGAAPDATTHAVVLPEAPLAAIKAYREQVDTDLQADIEALGNLALLLGAVIDQVEAWQGTDWAGRGDTFVNSLLDLLGSTYVRRRWPKLFLIMQAVSITSELTSSLAPGEQAHTRFRNAIGTILSFVWNPGRTLDDLDDTRPDAEGSTLNTARDTSFLVVDGLVRGIVAAIAVVDQTKDEDASNALGDVIVGWDAAALDVDSPARPTAADVLAARMVSLALRRAGATDSEQLRVTWMYLPRRLGTPARPHQLFLALGGTLTLDQVLNPGAIDAPTWSFRVDIRSDAGAALLIGGEDGVRPNATAASTSVSVGYRAVPDETGISYALPRATGTRLELGELAAVLTLSASGARILLRLDHCALVIDSADKDSFVRKLLGGRPIRKVFSLGLGYDAALGFIHEVHVPAGVDATGPEPPFDSSGPAGPPALEKTLPLGGGGVLGINVLEVVLRLAGRRAEPPESGWAAAAGGLVSFSTQLGPLYVRVDRLGLLAAMDTMTPSDERNLRVVDAHVDASRPTGIALDLRTGPVSGGGTIQHDPTTGDYVGALVLRFGKQITITCVGLASTRDREGNPLSSLLLIGTVEHLGWQAGVVTLDGFGLLYAADRTLDVAAVRAALPSGQLKHVLFPADPVKHLPELVSALRTFFPPREGTHIYGFLVKLTFGSAHPLLRADLALMLERDSVSETSRLLVLGRVSSVLPQEDNALLTLNLDVVGVFDLDTGSAALDAVLYDSKLCGRFVLTGAAAFRRERGQGFALAVGGFNPRFSPPASFPVLPRVSVALTTGDNPKLVIEAYLAITTNTLQFGAKASLYAAAYGFSIQGYIGFDVLVSFWPPHFIADFAAGVQLKRGSRNLFKVDVKGMLEGPIPLRVAGKATFGILWWDYTVSFDKTLIGGSGSVVTETIDVVAELLTRLADAGSWRAELPAAATQVAGVRNVPRAGLLLHPLGRLVVQQGLVPLNTTREIDRVGAFVPRDARRFALTEPRIGGATANVSPVSDEFPDSQFFEMSDAERLGAPGVVMREAGVSFGNDRYAADASTGVAEPFRYTEIVVGPDGVPVVLPDPRPAEPAQLRAGLRLAAAARAATRTSVTERYAGQDRPDAPRLAGLVGVS
ncbi:hypothetical protein HP550_05765 [Cellulomonas humilata]|uniref:DUF6603 domain-containing protein n=1 Tax=Cellulomonas humilata TaxID=144055 RepID=A0A7Y5ZZ19_9CELL|nr:DUF6603 domain-containing protein [Cellulomonas humilata]NUU16754.1 hypothetical protein [Cellulomonas humilata]